MTQPIFIGHGGWIALIAIAWAVHIIVGWYVGLCLKTGVRPRKPFGCEKCMGFWIGGTIATLHMGIINGVIYGLITSLVATLISKYAIGRGI